MLDIPIEGGGLILREFRMADIPSFARIASTEGFSFYAFPVPTTTSGEMTEAIRRFVCKCIDLQRASPDTGLRESYKLVVANITSPRKVVGYVALDEISELGGEKRDIGYLIDPKYQGRGYAFQACSMLLREFFAKTSHNTVWATVHPENGSSCSVLKKLGYKKTGDSTKIVRGVVEPRIVLCLERGDFFSSQEQPTVPVVNRRPLVAGAGAPIV